MKTKDIFALACVCIAVALFSGAGFTTTYIERGIHAFYSFPAFMIVASASSAVALMYWSAGRGFGTPEFVVSALWGVNTLTLFSIAIIAVAVTTDATVVAEEYPTALFILALAILGVTAYKVGSPELAAEEA
jgi:hypothetical protein